MKIPILRASVQTLSIIDAAITSLLLVATLLIGVLLPTFGVHSVTHQSSVNIPVNNDTTKVVVGAGADPDCFTYNSSDVYWWYYLNFQMYQKSVRQLGNVLDTSFCFILLVVVVSDVVLIKGVDLSTEVTATPKSIYYWLLCNTFVIGVLPLLATLSFRVADANGTMMDCGIGCGMPYFYITYRLLFGLMVVIYLCKIRAKLAKDPSGISVYKYLYI